ncbi:MAG: hypothetical protein HZB65_00625 [Candidatus Aenigmarchaeota archaeon]|nr:hypothetical protein [Candidatus Aenigmarchaeota archaeon]
MGSREFAKPLKFVKRFRVSSKMTICHFEDSGQIIFDRESTGQIHGEQSSPEFPR